MITLAFPTNPYPIHLPLGVTVTVRPLSTEIYEAARAKMARTVRELAEQVKIARESGFTIEGLPDLSDPDIRSGTSQFMFTVALAQSGITAWEGVGDTEGKPLPVSPEAVAQLMRIPAMAEAFVVTYTRPMVDLVSEGNG